MSAQPKPYRAALAPLLWAPAPHGMKRAVRFEPGYNDRGGAYGVHGMAVRFVLSGKYGAAHFLLNTGWIPGEKMTSSRADLYPSGSDLGYHSLVPMYEGAYEHGPCDFLDGRTCYSDGSGLWADDLLPEFIREGEPAVWSRLDAEYSRVATEFAEVHRWARSL